MAKAKRRWAFSAVSTGLMVGHGLVAVATVAIGALFLLLFLRHLSPAQPNLVVWRQTFIMTLIVIPCAHWLLMFVMPLWSGLAARGQTRVSRLWAWLGYFIPLASYWLPVQTLRALADGADSEHARLRTLIMVWGFARGLVAPSAVFGLFIVVYKSGLTGTPAALTIVVYMVLIIAATNLLSLLLITRMHRHLASHAVDARHAEVFA